MKTTEAPVTVTQTFPCSASTLWSALTNIEEMRRWYFDNIPGFNPRVGFTTEFVVANEDRTFTHCWEILEAQVNEKLSYRWTYSEYEGEAIAHFSLSGSDPVVLTVTMEVLADFDDSVTEFTLESCQGGWDYFIADSLKNYIDSTQNLNGVNSK